MSRITGNHGPLLKKITTGVLVPLLLVVGVPLTAVGAESCKGWNTEKFFESATVDEVRACLSAGEDPNKPDTQGLTALHRAARDTADPAVIEALLDGGANPRAYSIIGRLPGQFARRNKKIKGSDAYQRLRLGLAKRADWARVQAVPHETKAAVLLYKDAAAAESWRIRGRFEAATADSITLRLKGGQKRTFQKSAVRKVLTYRPFKKRTLGWVALGATSLLCLATVGPWDLVSGVYLIIPAASAAGFSFSGMGPVYDVPPEHRMLPQAVKQPVAQDNASGKQHEAERPSG